MNRGALALLTNYGGDSSDDDVPSGRVSTKRCHPESNKSNKKPNNSRLPVPRIITSKTQEDAATPIDDPSMHDGKIRSFPHERGNWATYVYIPHDPSDSILAQITANVINSLPELHLKPIDHYHISLTKTIVLKHHWIQPFVESIRNNILQFKKFIIFFDTLKVYCNEERTRTFIGLEIRSSYDTLIKLVEYLDVCLAEFRLPQFYKDPSFHMSIAWCVGDHEAKINDVLLQLRTYVEKLLTSYPDNSWYNYVQHLECKTGNKVYSFNLS